MMLNASESEQDVDDWVKSAMSVCGLSLSQRSKAVTPQPRKDVVVIPQASISQEGESSESSQENEDIPSDRSDSVSPTLSEVRDIDQLHPPDIKTDQDSPRSIVSWTDDSGSGKGKVTTTCRSHDIRIHSDLRIHNDLGTVTASMPSDIKRSLEMGVGTNFSKRLSGLGSSTLDSKMWNNKSKNDNKGVMGSGVCMNPRTRRDYLNDVFKVGSFSNARKLDNVDLDVHLAVRQQFYDQWARPKRGRYMSLENRCLRRNKPEDFTTRNAVKLKEFRKARTKLDDFLGGENNTNESPKPVSSVEVKIPKTYKKETQSANPDNRKQKPDKPEIDEDKDVMTVTIGDIDNSVKLEESNAKVEDSNDRRGLISHSFLEPFTFDRRTETAPMFVAYRGAYDISALRMSDYRPARTASRREDETTLRDVGNISGRYPWNKYHIFHLPVKLNQCPVSKKSSSERQEKYVNKENSHFLKIPLIPSKKSPVFSSNDNVFVSIKSSRSEDALNKAKTRAIQVVNREFQYPGHPSGFMGSPGHPNGFTGSPVDNDMSLVSQSTTSNMSKCGQQDRYKVLDLSGRASIKNKMASGPRQSTPRLESGLEVSSLMVRGETPKLFME